MFEILKAILYGIVEGITEWLPVSSTGHLLLLEEWLPFKDTSDEFMSMFDVVIQLGAIMAVVLIFWKKIWPFHLKKKEAQKTEDNLQLLGNVTCSKMTMIMWLKILVATVPAAIIGLLFDETFEKYFYNPVSISIALIAFGIAFIVVERVKKGKTFSINHIDEVTYQTALIIGLFQVLAAIFPGTSRSGATIIGALLIGVSRSVAAEFTFYLAIPVMFGASLLKAVKFVLSDVGITSTELGILLVASLVAFAVSMLVIRFLMDFVKKHDFSVFGWYRIVLGILVLLLAF